MIISNLILYASGLLLLQGLVRDLWILSKPREQSKPIKQASCLCVESSIGILGILLGILLLGSGIDWFILMTGWKWAIFVIVILSIGYGIRDLVLEWNPWRIRRDKDHINIVFTWKVK